MKTEIIMPAMSPSMTEGTLTKWLVKVGDQLKVGDTIAEIETDKATMEVESQIEGVVSEFLVKNGQDHIAIKTPIAIIETDSSTEKLKGKLFTNTIDDQPKKKVSIKQSTDLDSKIDKITVRESIRDAIAEEMRDDKNVFVILSISGAIVAEKNNVWRVKGVSLNIRSISGMKPISSILSASSTTIICTPVSRSFPLSK